MQRLTYRPGQVATVSGQYAQMLKGKRVTQVTVTKGEPFPPGPRGCVYLLTDKTRHRGGKRAIAE